MKKSMYALFDKTANIYLNPLSFINHGEAVRWLTTITNETEKETNVNKYPHHFSLWYLGTYDDQSGKTDNNGMNEIMEATSVKDYEQKYTLKELTNILDKRYGNNVVDIESAMYNKQEKN